MLMKPPAWVEWGLAAVVAVAALGGWLAPGSALAAAPVNDNFANRIALSGTNATASVNSSDATSEPGEPAHGGSAARRSVWWSWTTPVDLDAFITTGGSTTGIGTIQLDTMLAIYTGNDLTNLIPVAANDDGNAAAGVVTSRVQFRARAGITYQIAVDGVFGATGNIRLGINPPAPAWTCTNLDGEPVASTNFSGKVLMVNFWATYCSHCRAEIPDLIALQNQYQSDGLVVIGLSVDTTSTSNILNFVTANGMNYPVLLDNPAARSGFGGISGTPTTFVIDRRNLLRERVEGTRAKAAWEALLRPLLYANMNVQARLMPGQLQLVWPTNGATFMLQSSPSLEAPVWTDVPGSPQILEGLNVQSPQMISPRRFYRLRLVN